MAPGGGDDSSVGVLRFGMVDVYDEKEGTEYGALQDSCGYALEVAAGL